MIEIYEGRQTIKRFTANEFSLHVSGKTLLDQEMIPRLITRYNNAMQEKRSDYRARVSEEDNKNVLTNYKVKYIIIKK